MESWRLCGSFLLLLANLRMLVWSGSAPSFHWFWGNKTSGESQVGPATAFEKKHLWVGPNTSPKWNLKSILTHSLPPNENQMSLPARPHECFLAWFYAPKNLQATPFWLVNLVLSHLNVFCTKIPSIFQSPPPNVSAAQPSQTSITSCGVEVVRLKKKSMQHKQNLFQIIQNHQPEMVWSFFL